MKPEADPRSISALLGVALRIAQRIGLHSEAANTKHSILEAELRRRLWWSLVHFDARVSEMTEIKLSMLVPTWDCRIPVGKTIHLERRMALIVLDERERLRFETGHEKSSHKLRPDI